MRLQRLEIEQQMAVLRIETTNAQLHVEMPDRTMSIEYTPSEMTTTHEDPELLIESKGFKHTLKMDDIFTYSGQNEAKAKGEYEKGVKRTAQDGDYVANTKIRGNRLAQIQKRKILERKAMRMNSGKVPEDAMTIKGRPGKLKIDWSRHEVDITWEGNTFPQIYVDPPYAVEVYLDEKPYIRISLAADNAFVDISGHNVDMVV